MSFNRRNFLKGLGLMGLSASIPAHAKQENHSTSLLDSADQMQSFDFATAPYLQNLTDREVSICCIFNKPCIAWVEVLDNNQAIVETIYQVEDGMRNANTDLFKFRVKRNGPSLTYRVAAKEITRFEAYKIEYGQAIKSKEITANLASSNQDSVHALILNDIHENRNSYGVLYKKSGLPKKDLVFLNGDSFHYVNNQKDLTDKLLKPVSAEFAGQTPMVMVRGNHETRGAFARSYKPYFDYPEGKFYHAFKMGPVYWVVLDSGEDKPDSHEVYAGTVDYDGYRLEQKAWLEGVLKSKERKSARHTIVVTHIPFHHSDEWHGTKHNKECFHEVLQKNKVDAVISGHTHRHGFHEPNNEHNYYVIIGGGPKEGERTFIDVSAEGRKLEVSLVKETGEVLGTFGKGKG